MVALFARDLGGAGRNPMVVLHGLLGSSRNWLGAGRNLAETRHVWALDLRNHGQSPHAEPMSYDAMVEDVIAWLDRRGWMEVELMGHSLGGKVAMALACWHPTRVRRLTVVDIAPKDYLSRAHRAEFAAMHELRLDHLRSRAEAELRMEARVPDLGMRKFLLTNLERGEDGTWRWSINLPVLTAALPELERTPLHAGECYLGPTRFILGEKSPYVVASDHACIRAHFPSAEFVVIPGSGHNPHIDAREAFTRAVLAESPWA
jgi:esterase